MACCFVYFRINMLSWLDVAELWYRIRQQLSVSASSYTYSRDSCNNPCVVQVLLISFLQHPSKHLPFSRKRLLIKMNFLLRKSSTSLLLQGCFSSSTRRLRASNFGFNHALLFGVNYRRPRLGGTQPRKWCCSKHCKLMPFAQSSRNIRCALIHWRGIWKFKPR